MSEQSPEMGIDNPSPNLEEETQPKKMGVLFLDTPIHEVLNQTIDDSSKGVDSPRSLLALASYLPKNRYDTAVYSLDAHLRSTRLQSQKEKPSQLNESLPKVAELVREILTKNNPEVVCISGMYTYNINVAREIAQAVKDFNPEIKTVVGGAHATVAGYELINTSEGEEQSPVDYVLRGAGEAVTEQLLDELQKEKPDLQSIKGLLYRIKKMINGQETSWIYETVETPEPIASRDDIKTRTDQRRMRGESMAIDYNLWIRPDGLSIADVNHTLLATRGCRADCGFCGNKSVGNQKLMTSDQADFRGEIDYLASQGVRHISLFDDNLPESTTVDGERQYEWPALYEHVLSPIKKKYPDLVFTAQARVNSILEDEVMGTQDKEGFLKQWKDAGLERVYLGMETGSPIITKEMKKWQKVDWIIPAALCLKAAGIEVGGFWIVGYPGANLREETKSINFLETLLKSRVVVTDQEVILVTNIIPGDPSSDGKEVDGKSLSNRMPLNIIGKKVRVINDNNLLDQCLSFSPGKPASVNQDRFLGQLQDRYGINTENATISPLLDDTESHVAVPFTGTKMATDPRLRYNDRAKHPENFSIIGDEPAVYDLQGFEHPESGDPFYNSKGQPQPEIVLTAQEIADLNRKALDLSEKYLGTAVNVANSPLTPQEDRS